MKAEPVSISDSQRVRKDCGVHQHSSMRRGNIFSGENGPGFKLTTYLILTHTHTHTNSSFISYQYCFIFGRSLVQLQTSRSDARPTYLFCDCLAPSVYAGIRPSIKSRTLSSTPLLIHYSSIILSLPYI